MSKKRDYKLPRWFAENIDPGIADSELFRFSVTFPNKQKIEFDLVKGIDIDYDLLEEELEAIPAQYMYWAAVYSELKSMVTKQELRIRARKNIIAAKTINKYKDEKVRLTDKQLNSIIDKDNKLMELELVLATFQKQTGKAYHMVEAVRMKSENCRSLAGFKRQEYNQTQNQ